MKIHWKHFGNKGKKKKTFDELFRDYQKQYEEKQQQQIKKRKEKKK